MCPECKQDGLQMPMMAFFRSRIRIDCRNCHASYTSSLSGALNETRKILLALFGTLLGFSLVFALSAWKLWLLALVLLEVADTALKVTMHRRTIEKLRSR